MGGIKIDGTSIIIDLNGIISATAGSQVNSDWNATSGVAEILNKPTIPAAYSPPQGIATTSKPQFDGLGIGIAATATAGEIRATNNITAYYSDRRLKENVTVIADPITKVLKLNGICYTPNELATTFGYNKDDKIVGLFADEVESVLPEAVALAPFDRDENGNSKSGENYKTVKYEKVVPLLVEAIKQQQAIIDSQNAKIDMLMKHLGL